MSDREKHLPCTRYTLLIHTKLRSAAMKNKRMTLIETINDQNQIAARPVNADDADVYSVTGRDAKVQNRSARLQRNRYCSMLGTQSALAILLALITICLEPAKAVDPSGQSPKRTIFLRAYARKPDHRLTPDWSSYSNKKIKSSFEYSCGIGAGDQDLSIEGPREMAWLFRPGTAKQFIAPQVGSSPRSMSYPSLNVWRHHLLFALQQLRWELVTNPAQRPSKLGAFYGSEVPWNDSPAIRHLLDANYVNKDANLAGTISVPALSYRSYFQGTASVLLVFNQGRKVQVRLLESTLPKGVNSRLVETLLSLNGHPVAEFPNGETELEQIPLVCQFYFRNPSYMKRAKPQDQLLCNGTSEYYCPQKF